MVFGNDDRILAVNLQKSRHGVRFFINLGVFLSQSGETKIPKEYECHIRARLSQLTPTIDVQTALNLEDCSISSGERTRLISDSFRRRVLPFFDDMSTIECIKSSLHAGKYPYLVITLAAKRFLGIWE